MNTVQQLNDWLAVPTLLAPLAFLLAYGLFAPWWRSAWGQNIFLLGLISVGWGLLVMLSAALGTDYLARPAFILAQRILVIGIFTWRTVITIREIRRGRARKARQLAGLE